MRFIFLLLISISFNISMFSAEKQPEFPSTEEHQTYEDYKKALDEYFNSMESVKGKGLKPIKRYQWLLEQRMDENGQIPNMYEVYKDYLKYQKDYAKKFEELQSTEWKLIGPINRVPNNRAGLGRLNVIKVDPTNPNILWTGSATGGVWKSTDGGSTWRTFPFTEFASIGIGDLDIAPSDPNTVYAATGDRMAALGGGSTQYYNFYSVGIIKTTNGGNTWELTSPITGLQQSNSAYISGILIHPNDEDIVYASVYDNNTSSGNDGGLYYSSNGGNSWDKILDFSIWDIEFKPNNPNLIHQVEVQARTTKIIRTIDVSNPQSPSTVNMYQVNSSLRTEITVSPDEPDYIMAIHSANNSGLLGIDKSVDGGESWTRIQDSSPNYLASQNGGNGTGGQGFYDLCIEMDPSNANLVYIGGINGYRSLNGGSSFSQCMWAYQSIPGVSFVHPDIHGFGFGQDGRSYIVHDGGINYSTNDGQSWIDISDGISNTQYYRFGQSMTSDDVFIAGSQDNSTWVMEDGNWRIAFGGDGFHCLVDPNNDDVMYGSSNLSTSTGWIWKSNDKFRNSGSIIFGPSTLQGQNNTASGEQPMWVAPFEIDPNNSNVLYAGHRNVWKTTNAGQSWSRSSDFNITVRAIGVSPINSNYVWAAAGNRLYGSTDAGASWSLFYTAQGGNISSIQGSHDEASKCYISLVGFRSSDKVFEVNGAGNQTNITFSGLPNLGAVSIVEYELTGDLFLGMDAGVYRLDAGDNSWKAYSNGLPQVIISELSIHPRIQKIRAATYGRGIWEVDIKDCNLDAPNVLVSGETTICPGEELNLQLEGFYDDWTWSTGETTRSITIDGPGDYWVDVTDGSGCFARSEIIRVTVPEIDEPEVTSSNENNVICDGDSLRLRVNGFYDEYNWSNGETGRSIWVSEPGEYYVTIIEEGCEVTSESISVGVENSPNTPVITAIDITLRAPLSESYQWYRDGNEIQGATNQTYSPIDDGVYQVEVFNEGGCSAISEGYTVTWFSIEDSQFSEISTSPNPNDGKFTIEVNTGDLRTVQLFVFDMNGNEIFASSNIAVSGDFSQRIDLGDAVPGVYFVQLKSGRDQITTKIIVE